jgi:hypothetical protein
MGLSAHHQWSATAAILGATSNFSKNGIRRAITAKEHEEAFRQAARQLQRERGGGRVWGEDIRQLLAGQFGVAYTLNGVYDLTWTIRTSTFLQALPPPSVIVQRSQTVIRVFRL